MSCKLFVIKISLRNYALTIVKEDLLVNFVIQQERLKKRVLNCRIGKRQL